MNYNRPLLVALIQENKTGNTLINADLMIFLWNFLLNFSINNTSIKIKRFFSFLKANPKKGNERIQKNKNEATLNVNFIAFLYSVEC